MQRSPPASVGSGTGLLKAVPQRLVLLCLHFLFA